MNSRSEDYRRRADELLSRATSEPDMKRRSDMIVEAAHWHRMAQDAGDEDRPDEDEPDET